MVCISACPYQAEEQLTTSLLGQAYQSLWLVRALRRLDSGSNYLVFWSSLAPQPGCDSQHHARPLTGSSIPLKVATLSVRSARDRYQSRTVPRLPVAEHRVLSISTRKVMRINRRTTTHDGIRRLRCEKIRVSLHIFEISANANPLVGYFFAIRFSPERCEKASYLSDLRVARLGSRSSTIELHPHD